MCCYIKKVPWHLENNIIYGRGVFVQHGASVLVCFDTFYLQLYRFGYCFHLPAQALFVSSKNLLHSKEVDVSKCNAQTLCSWAEEIFIFNPFPTGRERNTKRTRKPTNTLSPLHDGLALLPPGEPASSTQPERPAHHPRSVAWHDPCSPVGFLFYQRSHW